MPGNALNEVVCVEVGESKLPARSAADEVEPPAVVAGATTEYYACSSENQR